MIDVISFESTDGENAKATLEVRVGCMQLSLTKKGVGGIAATMDILTSLAYHLGFEADITGIYAHTKRDRTTYSKAVVRCRTKYHRPKIFRGEAIDSDPIKSFCLAHIAAYEALIAERGYSYD